MLENGKRVAAFDYGRKRIGYALSDTLLITANPKDVFDNSDNLIDIIRLRLEQDNVGLLIIGRPERNDVNSSLVDEIIEFAKSLHEVTKINFEFQDESYSSKMAVERMIEGGKKKKFRREKSNTDMYAAAVILEEYLNRI